MNLTSWGATTLDPLKHIYNQQTPYYFTKYCQYGHEMTELSTNVTGSTGVPNIP